MKRKHAFTLIELLVVIAIIGLLLAIILPAMKKATEYARKINCQSNLHQVGVAMSIYESETNYNFRNFKSAKGMSPDSDAIKRTWFWNNGTGDYAHEPQPFAIGFLMKANILPNREIFFCPGVKNLSYDRNYPLSRVQAGDFTPWETDDIYREVGRSLPVGDRPLFWSSYVWLWKKEIREQVTSVSNMSSGAMMCDTTTGIWDFAEGTDPTRLGRLLNEMEITRAYQHGNVLMQDYSVENPSDRDDKLVLWLWNSDRWAGIGY